MSVLLSKDMSTAAFIRIRHWSFSYARYIHSTHSQTMSPRSFKLYLIPKIIFFFFFSGNFGTQFYFHVSSSNAFCTPVQPVLLDLTLLIWETETGSTTPHSVENSFGKDCTWSKTDCGMNKYYYGANNKNDNVAHCAIITSPNEVYTNKINVQIFRNVITL